MTPISFTVYDGVHKLQAFTKSLLKQKKSQREKRGRRRARSERAVNRGAGTSSAATRSKELVPPPSFKFNMTKETPTTSTCSCRVRGPQLQLLARRSDVVSFRFTHPGISCKVDRWRGRILRKQVSWDYECCHSSYSIPARAGRALFLARKNRKAMGTTVHARNNRSFETFVVLRLRCGSRNPWDFFFSWCSLPSLGFCLPKSFLSSLYFGYKRVYTASVSFGALYIDSRNFAISSWF